MTTNTQSVPDTYQKAAGAEHYSQDANVLVQEQTAGRSTSASQRYAEMCRAIRSYGFWMLMSAVLGLLPGFDIGWAAVVLLVGLMSFYFYDAAGMLLINAAMFGLAALGNLLAAGQTGWGFLGVVQIIWGVLAYKAYRNYRRTKAEYQAEQPSHAGLSDQFNRRESLMVWLAPVFGAIGLLGACAIFPLGVIYYGATSQEPAQAVSTALGATLQLGILGMPAGIAAADLGQGPKAAAIAGIVLGVASALFLVVLFILAAVGGA